MRVWLQGRWVVVVAGGVVALALTGCESCRPQTADTRGLDAADAADAATSTQASGADVNLPLTDRPPGMPEGPKQKTISMTVRAEVVIDGVWIPDQNLLGYFKDLYEKSPEKELVIKADKGLKYKEVRRIMQLVNQAGFDGAGLVTDKREKLEG